MMTDDEKFDEEKYAQSDILSAQLPICYCSGCHEIRDEHEMIENTPCCVHCCDKCP